MKLMVLKFCNILLFLTAVALLSGLMFLDMYFEGINFDSILFYFRTISGYGNVVAAGQHVYIVITSMFLFVLLFYLLLIRFYRLGLWGWIILYVPILVYANYRLDLIGFLLPISEKNDYYAQNYISPDTVEIDFPESKKNLIVVYLESIENTYSNPKIFSNNLLPRLTEIAHNNISFSQYQQTTGTYWSMASFVAGSCGIALNLFGRDNIVLDKKYFLPHITCLQDILHKENYQIAFLKGDLLSFAGQDLFLNNHADGKIETVDINYFSGSQQNWKGDLWGAKDSLLYQKAKETIEKMSQEKDPFFVTIFTLDTHHYEGYLDDKCSQNYGDFRDKVVCADKMAGEFYDWFEKQPFAKDTVLVFMGDHLAMNNDIYNKYLKNNKKLRRIFLAIINSAVKNNNIDREFTALDIFPTLLESIGVKISGHCLGLGCSVLSNPLTLLEKEGIDGLSNKLSYPSSYYRKFIFGR